MRGKEKLRRVAAKGRVWRYEARRMRGGRFFVQKERRRAGIALLIFGFLWLNVKCYDVLFVPEIDDAIELMQAAVNRTSAGSEREQPEKKIDFVMTEGEKEEYGTEGQQEILTVEYKEEDTAILTVNRLVGEIPEIHEPEQEVKETVQPRITEKICVADVLKERFGALNKIRFQDFISNYYIVDPSTKAVESDFKIETLVGKKVSIKKTDQPQILIYHTHGSEAFADSRPGKTEDTVIGAGELLAGYLREEYGFSVIHVTDVFDRKADGSDDRNNAYNNTLPVIREVLEENPTIEVIIDLHRDSGEARRTTVNGQSMAKIMLFNGLCRTVDGPITYYSNSNLTGNLAFSLQTQVTGNELFPGLMHRIYLKSYRYNMQLMDKYLLVELGTQKNTTAEAMASMKPFAEILAAVLTE